MKFLIITEVNEKVATGHMMEACELADEFIDKGHSVTLLVNEECQKGLLNRIHCKHFFYRKTLEEDINNVCVLIEREEPDVVITDLRLIDNCDVNIIKNKSKKPIVCIDELGQRRIDADVIINPMVDSYFWNYPNSEGKKYFGHEYLVLPRIITFYHDKKKEIRPSINNICISMGGVDLYGTTLKLIKWLPEVFEDLSIDCVLGSGFDYEEELLSLIKGIKSSININVMRNINNIYDYFYNADLAFCAGGNTLHELACIGTPAVVIPTMSHEINNGKEFERLGCALCVEESKKITKEKLEKAIKAMSYLTRESMSSFGKKNVDGCGVHRTLDICEKV